MEASVALPLWLRTAALGDTSMDLSLGDHLAIDRFLTGVLEDYRQGRVSLIKARESLARAIVSAAREQELDFSRHIRGEGQPGDKRQRELL